LVRNCVVIGLSLLLFSCSPTPQSKTSKKIANRILTGKKSYAQIRPNKEIPGIVDGLIKSKGNLNQRYNTKFKKDNKKIPILIWAIESYDIESVKRLLKHGANPDVTTLPGAKTTALIALPFDTDLFTPQDTKILNRRKRSCTICKILLDAKADVNRKDRIGNTALMEAARAGREDLCKVLINAGASVNAKDITKSTALHMAAAKGYWKVVKLLLKKRANKKAKDSMKDTALSLAKKRSDEKLYNQCRVELPCAFSNADYDKTIKLLK